MIWGVEGTGIELDTAELLGPERNATLCLCALFLAVPAEKVHGLALYLLEAGSNYHAKDLARYLGICPHTASQKTLKARRAVEAILRKMEKRKRKGLHLKMERRPDLVALRTSAERMEEDGAETGPRIAQDCADGAGTGEDTPNG